ncbi:MAG: hypothetical protein D6765_01300 [Bacteroidetes bacterium]|nr:MAG: hypothetical protein D6765_01300 [Bacteroidota bacterium]
MNRIFLFSLLLLSGLGCQSGDGGTSQAAQPAVEPAFTPNARFKYYHHIKNEGPHPKSGDLVRFRYVMHTGERVVYDSRNTGGNLEMSFPDKEQLERMGPQPLIEGLSVMAPGDSITLFFPMTNIVKARDLEGVDTMIYEIVLVEVDPNGVPQTPGGIGAGPPERQ